MNLGDPGTSAMPCTVQDRFQERILNFDSSYMNFKFEFDRGMRATVSLSEIARANAPGDTSSVSLYPSGSSKDTACTAPPDSSWNDYPIRLARSGRYLHHWYAVKVGCNGVTGVDTRIELKVTPDW